MVKGMAFYAYSVRDVPRARTFYGEILGLRPGDAVSDHWVEFDVGNVTFGVGNGEGLGFPPGSSTGAAFEVDDLHAMRARLVAHGVEIDEIHEFPGCLVCFARDPEGNRFALHQLRQPVTENVA